jgi:hypothetical protein
LTVSWVLFCCRFPPVVGLVQSDLSDNVSNFFTRDTTGEFEPMTYKEGRLCEDEVDASRYLVYLEMKVTN